MTSTSPPKRLGEVIRLRPEVLEGRLDPAVSLQRVVEGEGWEADPVGFLDRTYITSNMKHALLAMLASLTAKPSLKLGDEYIVGSHVIVLPSLLGGGKTHLLAFLYHVARLVSGGGDLSLLEEREPELYRIVVSARESLRNRRLRIAVVVGDSERLAPRPGLAVEVNGWRVETLWGYVLASLGVMDEDLYERYERQRIVPGRDALEDILGDEPNLILIDEIPSYLGSLPPDLRPNVVTFLKHLFEAANNTARTVVIVTLPAEIRPDRDTIRVEHGISGAENREYIEEIYKMADRIDSRVIPPLDIETDIVPVLRRRLLENTEQELESEGRRLASIIKNLMDTVYQEALRREYRGEEAFLERVEKGYPFHPAFIDVLLNLGTYVEGFGRTRSIIKLVRDVLVRNEIKDASLVMPWHIPVEDDETRSRILTGNSKADYYRKVLSEDLQIIEENANSDKEKILGRNIVKTVWLYSVALSALRTSDLVEKSPSKEGLPAIVLEPLQIYNDIKSIDVINVVEKIIQEWRASLQEFKDRLLYPPIKDPSGEVRRYYYRFTKDVVLAHLENALNQIVVSKGDRIQTIRYLLNPVMLDEVKRNIYQIDDPALTLVIVPIEHEIIKIAELLPRNNTYVLSARFDRGIDDPAAKSAKRFLESFRIKVDAKNIWDLINSMGILIEAIDVAMDDIVRYYIDKEDKILREMLKKILRKNLETAKKQFGNLVELLLTKIYAGRGGKEEFTVERLEMLGGREESLSNLVKRFESHLVRNRGYLTDIDEDTLLLLARLMNRVGQDPVNGEPIIARPMSLGELWSYYLTTTDSEIKPHLLRWTDFKQGVLKLHSEREAIDRLALILKDDDGKIILWKKTYPVDKPPDMLLDTDSYKINEIETYARKLYQGQGDPVKKIEIVHPLMIVEEYLETLLSEEKSPIRRDGVEYRRTYYLLIDDDKKIPLSQVKDQYKGDPYNLYRTIANGIIVFEDTPVEKTYEAILVSPERGDLIEVEKGKTVPVEVEAASDDYPYKVIVRYEVLSESGTILDQGILGTINEPGDKSFYSSISGEIGLPENPGVYEVNLYAEGLYPGDKPKHIGTFKVKITGLSCEDQVKTIARREDLEVLGDKYDTVSIERIILRFREDTARIASIALQQLFSSLLRAQEYKPRISSRINFEEPTTNAVIGVTLDSADLSPGVVRVLLNVMELMSQGWAPIAGSEIEILLRNARVDDIAEILPSDIYRAKIDIEVIARTCRYIS